MTQPASPGVVLAVLTFRRPGDLRDVLPLLVAQGDSVDDDVEVLVVDNDPDASARELVAGLDLRGVRYCHEPRPGIAAGRNRALDEAGDAGVLVFIDDDERPSQDWLAQMLELHRTSGATAVVGAVVSDYEHEPDPWIVEGRFFDRRRLPTGTVIDTAATNNLLLDLARLGGLRFDERFGLSGGSDTLFSRALVRAGGQMVWCDEAFVLDKVPASRLTRRWVMQKALRSGNSWSRTSLELASSPLERVRQRLVLTARGGVRAAGGAVQAVLGTLTRSRARQARGCRTAARGAGMASGAWGYVYQEYRRPAPAARPATTPGPAGRRRSEPARRVVRWGRKRAKRGFSHAQAANLRVRNRVLSSSVLGDADAAVSLTSYGDRVRDVALTVESIARGSVRPRRVVLWLDDPRTFGALPASLRRLQARGLEIRLTSNYGPHTKYFPYVLDASEAPYPLVTADDDIIYPASWLSGLLESHRAHPDVVSCYRASVVALDGEALAAYDSWPRCTSTEASVTHFATGVAGVLYPASMLRELRRRGDVFMSSTPRADDVWLHWVALRARVAVRQVARTPRHFPLLPGSQDQALALQNVGAGMNDRWIEAVYDRDDVEALRGAGAPDIGR